MATQQHFETDLLPTSGGDLVITFLGHASLILNFQAKNYYVDPFGRVADYSKLLKADAILVTHEHSDHLDPEALAAIRTGDTEVVLNERGAERVKGGVVMKNGDVRTVQGVRVEAVPAYNVVHKRENGQPFHPRGEGNGYILTLGDKRLYLAGDTENVPEVKALQGIDYAFLPMNLPYTMTPEMVADAARAIRPAIVYPYHYGNTDPDRLVELLKGEPIEVRIRPLS